MTTEHPDFPASYEACFLTACPLRENCLHKLCADGLSDEVTAGRAILPSALLDRNLVGGRCRHYAEAKLVTCYADFSHLFDCVTKKDHPRLSRAVYAYLGGRSNYYRYSNAERNCFLTEDQARDIAAIFAQYGYPAPDYGRQFQVYNY